MNIQTSGGASGGPDNPACGSLSLEELGLLRRRVYTALAPFVETEPLLTWMWLWEEEYVGGEMDVLQGFVAQICRGELSTLSASMLHNLHCHLQRDEAELLEDPYPLMLAQRSGHLSLPDTVPTDAEGTQVFVAILRTLLARLDAEDRYHSHQVCHYVSESLGGYHGGLSVAQVQELQHCLQGEALAVQQCYSAKQISRVLYLLHVGMAEFIGPQRADRYMAESVNPFAGVS